MRKVLLILIVFSALIQSLVADESFPFDILFTKESISEAHFENQAGDKIESLSFPIVQSINQSVSVDVYAAYHIFAGEKVDLFFVPGNATDSNYTAEGPMLMKASEPFNGLNYNVAVDGGGSLIFSDGNTDRITDSLTLAERTVNVTSTDSESEGRSKVTLTMNPPVIDGNVGYMEGQYTGYIILQVTKE